MVSTRFKGFMGTNLLVVGAFMIGNAIHQSVVQGQYPVTSPAAVITSAVGLGLIVVGHRWYRPLNEYISVPSDEDPGDGETENDPKGKAPEMSPLSDEDFENLEADDTN